MSDKNKKLLIKIALNLGILMPDNQNCLHELDSIVLHQL